MRVNLASLVAILFGLLFGALALLLSPAKAFLAVVGLAAAVTILRFPFWACCCLRPWRRSCRIPRLTWAFAPR